MLWLNFSQHVKVYILDMASKLFHSISHYGTNQFIGQAKKHYEKNKKKKKKKIEKNKHLTSPQAELDLFHMYLTSSQTISLLDIAAYFGGISLFLRRSPNSELQNFLMYLLRLPIWNFRPPYQTSRISLYFSPFGNRKISLSGFPDVSHVCTAVNT